MRDCCPRQGQIRVVLADDHALLRQGVAYILAAEPDIAVVGEGASADEAIHLAATLLPDLILLDLTMPGGGLPAARAISAACPATKIVMLTASEDEEDMRQAVQAGAQGYVLKGVPARELVQVLRAVAGGAAYVTPPLAASLLPAADPLDREVAWTDRERLILAGIAAGDNPETIGDRLQLSARTVQRILTNSLRKLQVQTIGARQ